MKSVFAKPLSQKVAEIFVFTMIPVIGAIVTFCLVALIVDLGTHGLPTDTFAKYFALGMTAMVVTINVGYWTIVRFIISEYQSDEEWEQSRRWQAQQRIDAENYANG